METLKETLYKFQKPCFSVLIVLLISIILCIYSFSYYFASLSKDSEQKSDSIKMIKYSQDQQENGNRYDISKSNKKHNLGNSNQNKRLKLVNSVCANYKEDTNLNKNYILDPGSKIKGKFTLEPKSKLLLCNVMKQGTTTWARIFIQLYLPNAANWKAKKWQEYSPFNVGYQVKLRELQKKAFNANKQRKILQSLEQPDHDYFAFFVCRNPIERLKSLYSYSLDLGRFKKNSKPKNFKDFVLKVFSKNSPHAFNSMFSLCSPCTRHYDAIIRMETFSKDSRYILKTRGKEKDVQISHSNNHGSQTVKKEEVKKLFTGIPKENIEILVQRLRPDFELCGYNNTLKWILDV